MSLEKIMNNPIQSISDFMLASDFTYFVFDLGKRVSLLENDQFLAIEQQLQVYPYPLQQSAWLGIVFHPREQVDSPIIWFLKFPLDEMGFIQLEAKDAFLRQVLEHLGENILALQQGEGHTDALKESTYAFKPKQERLAIFHAMTTRLLDKPASHFYAHACDYVQGKVGFDQWAFLGLQGLADLVMRLDEGDNEALLANALDQLPDTPLLTIAELLENASPKRELSLALKTQLDAVLTDPTVHRNQLAMIAALLRALSNSQEVSLRYEACHAVLTTDLGKEIELLAVISGRMWVDLQNRSLLKAYLEKAAANEQPVFNALLADLMAMPTMRDAVLAQLRRSERSEQLSMRIGQFMQVLQAN